MDWSMAGTWKDGVISAVMDGRVGRDVGGVGCRSWNDEQDQTGLQEKSDILAEREM